MGPAWRAMNYVSRSGISIESLRPIFILPGGFWAQLLRRDGRYQMITGRADSAIDNDAHKYPHVLTLFIMFTIRDENHKLISDLEA